MRQAHEAVDCKEIKSSRLLVSVRVHLADIYRERLLQRRLVHLE